MLDADNFDEKFAKKLGKVSIYSDGGESKYKYNVVIWKSTDDSKHPDKWVMDEKLKIYGELSPVCDDIKGGAVEYKNKSFILKEVPKVLEVFFLNF